MTTHIAAVLLFLAGALYGVALAGAVLFSVWGAGY